MVSLSLRCIDMNKRIKEFAEQAGFRSNVTVSDGQGDHIITQTEERLEKFAELIVRECANICFSEAQGHSMAFGEHCGIVIKEHFRVEE
jgi:hypothetical protein